MIVPRKTVSELRMIYETTEETVSISVSETKIRFSNATLSLTSKVVDGSFPDYDGLFQKIMLKDWLLTRQNLPSQLIE